VQRVELVLRSSSTNSDARRWLAALSILAGTGATQLAEPVTPQTDMLIMSWVIGSWVKRWRNSVHATPPMP
jgi:hypothetical protein